MAYIILAEDDPAIRDIITESLHTHEVLATENGALALAAAATRVPDLFIFDISMPVMDGLAACRAVKADARLKRVPILMLTGAGKVSEVEEGFSAKADDYMVKPFSPRILSGRIDQLLKKFSKP